MSGKNISRRQFVTLTAATAAVSPSGFTELRHFKTAEDVKRYYFAGQRISQLTYNTQNMIASGSTDLPMYTVARIGPEI